MNSGILKFEELMKTDETFQKKLQKAAESYDGENTEEAVFNNLLSPLAQEYDIHATFEEFKDYIGQLKDKEIDESELNQIAGGTTKGFGATACYGIGVGGGGHGQDGVINAICIIVGTGDQVGACAGEGQLA